MRIGTALLCLSCSAATAAAQEKKQSVEIGTSLGVTVLSQSGETFTTVGVPVAQGPVPLFGQATLYATIFATPSVMIEPQLSFSHLSGGGRDRKSVVRERVEIWVGGERPRKKRL